MDRVFLDANVLFSAAYGSKGLEVLWYWAHKRKCLLISSAYAIEEARRNLEPGHQSRLKELVGELMIVSEMPLARSIPVRLSDKDKPILAAAINARATHLLTGDLRHFGHLQGQIVSGVRICTPRDYLNEDDP